jgi:hypothetical protein
MGNDGGGGARLDVKKDLSPEQLRDMLIKNWMTHDALWYKEVAAKFGMREASPMNLQVCRNLGRIEFGRLMKWLKAVTPKDMPAYRALFDAGKALFFPDFMSVEIDYPDPRSQVFRVADCFAHRGMEKLGLLKDYECGIFERIEGWFDAMGVSYLRQPDLKRCLRLTGEACTVTMTFDFA